MPTSYRSLKRFLPDLGRMGQRSMAGLIALASISAYVAPMSGEARAGVHAIKTGCCAVLDAASDTAGTERDQAFLGSNLRTAEEASQSRAEALYEATSRDAETFEAALLIPEIRLKLEGALHQKLSDQILRRLVAQAKLEAVYWYKYMQGFERGPSSALAE